MGSDDSDRRDIAIERSLGRIEGAQSSLIGRLDRFESSVSANNADAQESRRRLHELLQKHGADVANVRERLSLVEKQVRDTGALMSTFAPLATVSELADAHAAMERSVDELRSAKDKVEGAAAGVKHLGKGLWAVLVAFGGVVGGTVVALLERFFGGTPPPPGAVH